MRRHRNRGGCRANDRTCERAAHVLEESDWRHARRLSRPHRARSCFRIARPAASPHERRQFSEYLAGAFAPAAMQRREILVALIEATAHPDLQTVSLVADEVDRHADREIAAHR